MTCARCARESESNPAEPAPECPGPLAPATFRHPARQFETQAGLPSPPGIRVDSDQTRQARPEPLNRGMPWQIVVEAIVSSAMIDVGRARRASEPCLVSSMGMGSSRPRGPWISPGLS